MVAHELVLGVKTNWAMAPNPKVARIAVPTNSAVVFRSCIHKKTICVDHGIVVVCLRLGQKRIANIEHCGVMLEVRWNKWLTITF